MAKAGERSTQADYLTAVSQAAYTVVARRYRPQQFAELTGQEHVAQALSNAITTGRIAHAYLFTGPRGVGKTSSARILAKALNCEKGPTPTPCDACDICKRIAASDDIDVIEIDGASNTKVEEARELRSNVGFRPTRARFKIYIIDEVHMLSVSAFNALLKTMEEPPPHVKFILATTEVQKIPITILSRCQRYNFHTVSTAKLFESLRAIAEKEGLEAEPEALKILARRANGSIRDSQTLLEQALSAVGGSLSADRVHELFGTATEERVIELATAIVANDAKSAVERIVAAAVEGLQLGELLDQLTEFWRKLMLASVGGLDHESIDATAAEEPLLKEAVEKLPLDAILAGLDILSATKQKLHGTSQTQLLLEVAAVRLARLNDLLSVAQLSQWIATGVTDGSTVPATSDQKVEKKKTPVVAEVKQKPAVASNGSASIENLWPEVLEQLGQLLPNYLRQAHNPPAISGPNSLAIRFASRYSSSYEMVRSDRNVELIRKALRVITGAEWQVRIDLDPPTDEETVEASKHAARGPSTSPRDRVLNHPFFRAAQTALGAQLLGFDEGYDPEAVGVGVAPAAVPNIDPDDPLAATAETTDEDAT